ncbi:hypothetical protein [Gottfriedia solisilvae]|uniref:Uncharacterized protein n=1 Tax=Gottfriedia solisilvae TaxID=1516104 RepID=A0A8J3AEI9_9BACI|nr:hypothetical protein [Gottfriedia solisilvae]GGI12897.1 hypothetical protein GCM10007380_15210 [Gottfriedia solisilvae]
MDHTFKQINLYYDIVQSDLVIISTGRLVGLGIIEIENIEKVTVPFQDSELYNKINNCLEQCYSRIPPIPAKSSSLAIMLNKKNYSQATKNKKLIVLTWDEDEGYIICPTQKEKRNGYQHLVESQLILGQKLDETNLTSAINKCIELSTIF